MRSHSKYVAALSGNRRIPRSMISTSHSASSQLILMVAWLNFLDFVANKNEQRLAGNDDFASIEAVALATQIS
jgi:hypothetical protein